MVVRGAFELDLQVLKDKLVELGQLTDQALNDSIEALTTQNIDQALTVIDDDTPIDLLDEEINDFAILLITKQQPVAIDLRRIIVAIKVSTDVERIADFAVNIAKATIRIGEKKHIKSLDKIVKMQEHAIQMLNLAIQAYETEDVLLAKKVVEMDDFVDQLYGENIRELLELTKTNSEQMAQITQLSFVCRYIERIADHATNIAENIFYIVKGKRYELND
ncbi:phosphate signaling complex protein PhoU [Cytobacillus sp. IB215665]|uniref:phosphate signaling complex protein PhoU n=1 Tax=Cytobacillus sp. IB215665 TaxID=3097357 RepID=UPI002A1344DF|nr:phosphate signaling complex protein PhoU [Cytobacillus sp. IB215665]MDX8364227.1 phosphate signaling complex protein PhoU [Cytobacillus sp. IB215665]